MTVYDPEKFLESTVRCIKEYAETGFDNSILDDNGDPVGLDLYEIVMQFPGADIDAKNVPLSKVMVHFEIDDTPEHIIGMGDNIFNMNFSEVDFTVRPQEARLHRINFDVGVWSSDRTGGTTQRLRARQVLSELFSGAIAIESLRASSDGGNGAIEILYFTGGRFVTERINDVNVYRIVDSQLEVRVYSRTPIPAVGGPAIEEILQNPNLTVL